MEIKKIDLNSNDAASPSPVATSTPKSKSFTPLYVVIALVLGVSTGALIKNFKSGSGGGMSGVTSPEVGGSIQPGEVFGAKDDSVFADEATGILEAGGINGEGTHKLLRSGGVSKTAYLTSSVLDLDQFIGFKISIWGETFTGQQAGWLMDVGRVKVEELTPTPLDE